MLVWMTVISIVSILVHKERSDLLTRQIFFRYFVFMWGILVARIILFNPLIIKHRLLFLITAIITMCIGRAIISHSVLTLSTNYYNLSKLEGFTTMGMGFSAILYLVVTSKKHLLNLLSNRVMRFVGLRSCNFYLLHGLILSLVA